MELPSFNGCVARLRRLSPTGVPQSGATASVVSVGVIEGELSLTQTGDSATDWRQRLPDGTYVSDPDDRPTNHVSASIEFWKVTPELYELASGAVLRPNWDDVNDGFEILNIPPVRSFALEVWSLSTTTEWIYWLVPRLVDAEVSGVTVENDAHSFTLTAESLPNPNWGVGPYNVIPINGLGTAGPLLTPVTGVLVAHRTTIAPPTGDGYVAVA